MVLLYDLSGQFWMTQIGLVRVGTETRCFEVCQAVRMNTLSKLTFADSRRFQDLCMDLFPGINVKDIEYQELEAVIRETIREMRLAEIDSQIYKMLQFHEACQQRMGVGIVGPSGCGKSTIWKVLEAAYKKQGKEVCSSCHEPQINAQSQTLGAYGP